MKFFFQEKDKKSDALFKRIEQACEGLIYISETDAPVTAFAGDQTPDITSETILRQTGRDANEHIEEAPFHEVFGRLTAHKDWHGEREIERAKKFLELKKLLEENLRDLKVFRIGTIQLAIYAVGIDKGGYLMGVTTRAVET